MKRVEIEWEDSTAIGGWSDSGDLELCQCKTVGYLVTKNRNRVVVVQSTSNGGGSEEHFDNRFGIPRKCIKKITELK